MFRQIECWDVELEQNLLIKDIGYWFETLKNKSCQTIMLDFKKSSKIEQTHSFNGQRFLNF